MAAPMQRTREPGIYKRGGSYVIVWRDRGRQHKEAFRTMKEAERAKGKRKQGDRQAESRERFDDYARRWVTTYNGRGGRGITASTRANYTRAIEKHAIPYFGRQRMKDLHANDVRGFITHLRDSGAPAPSIRKYVLAVKVLLATAYEDRDIATNPAQGVKLELPAPARERVRVLTRKQLGLVLAALPEQHRPFFTFLAQTGLRISEAIGAQWQHVELGAHPHVKVRRQLYHGEVRELKSRAGRRDVPLSPAMRDTLLALRGKRYGGPDAPVWATQRGCPLDAHNLRARVLHPTATALGLVGDDGKPWVGFHTFRHTCASLLFANGRDVKQVQGWLGHAKASFTLDTYVHLLDSGLGTADFLDAQVHPQVERSPSL
jgi:integrase